MSEYKKKGVKYAEGDNIKATNLSKAKVESYAAKVARVMKFKVGDDPMDLVQALSGRIHYKDYGELLAHDGSILVHGLCDFDILLPNFTSRSRDNFTIAHELGHYYLHSDQGEKPIIVNRQGTGRIEWEANWFAAALLMPEREFKETAKNEDDIATIARIFGVSKEAASVRRNALKV